MNIIPSSKKKAENTTDCTKTTQEHLRWARFEPNGEWKDFADFEDYYCEFLLSSSYSPLPPPLHCPDVLAQNNAIDCSCLNSHHLYTQLPSAQVWQLHSKEVHNCLDLPPLLHTGFIRLSYGFQGTFAGKHCILLWVFEGSGLPMHDKEVTCVENMQEWKAASLSLISYYPCLVVPLN